MAKALEGNPTELLNSARDVLDKNWRDGFTIPDPTLYPHQWSWDSAFIAIGYSHYDPPKAVRELEYLFEAQWDDGMLPHMVFNPRRDDYEPGPEFWGTHHAEKAPDNRETSGIVQPPVHATAVREVYENNPDNDEVRAFVESSLDNLVNWHDWLYRERDPEDEGLVSIRHPWESGMDNSPIWDLVFDQMDLSEDDIPDYERRDDEVADPEDRPGNDTYDRYAYLVQLGYEYDFNEHDILENSPFVVQDALFNTALVQSNRDLAWLLEEFDRDGSEYQKLADQTTDAMIDKLLVEDSHLYEDYDVANDRILDVHTAGGFVPLYAGIPTEQQAKLMLDYMNSQCFCPVDDDCYALPSYDRSESDFSGGQFWRGPVWLNINWFLYHGLRRYGFDDYAEWVYRSIVRLPECFGFCEHYDPGEGKGHGAQQFSWSAALTIDLMEQNELTNGSPS